MYFSFPLIYCILFALSSLLKFARKVDLLFVKLVNVGARAIIKWAEFCKRIGRSLPAASFSCSFSAFCDSAASPRALLSLVYSRRIAEFLHRVPRCNSSVYASRISARPAMRSRIKITNIGVAGSAVSQIYSKRKVNPRHRFSAEKIVRGREFFSSLASFLYPCFHDTFINN